MKAAPFISALLFSASAWAETYNFYAKILDDYKLLRLINDGPDLRYEFLAFIESIGPYHNFSVNDGVVTTGDPANLKVFGIYDDKLAFGPSSTVEPFKIKLDGDLKIVNLKPNAFKNRSRYTGVIFNKEFSKFGSKSTSVDIYLLSSSEAKMRMFSPKNHTREKVEMQPMYNNNEKRATDQNRELDKRYEKYDYFIGNSRTFTRDAGDTRGLKKRQYFEKHPSTPPVPYPTPKPNK